jgi:hypothetical protein
LGGADLSENAHMARINGVKLARVEPDLVDRLRQYGESDVLWAWPVHRDGEEALLAATEWGLRLVTRAGEQRLNWNDVGSTEVDGVTTCVLRPTSGAASRLQFRSDEGLEQFVSLLEEPDAPGLTEPGGQPQATAQALQESLTRIEAHLARIVELLDHRDLQ